MKIVNEGPGGYAAYVATKTPTNLELVIDEYDFLIMNKAQQHEVLVHEMVHLAMRSEGIGVYKDVPAWFMEGTTEFVAGTSGHFGNTTSTARFSSIISALDGSTGRLSGDFYAASSAAVVFMHHQLKGDADSDFKGVMNDLKTMDYVFESPTAGSLTFQIGANEGQIMTIDLPGVSSSNLGLTFVDISTQGGASSAITTFDTAIKNISEQRSLLGAYQNRLEHTLNNLSNTAENLTAAESRIRDTDMAKEMMNFTKQNILMQAAQSMLSQANQQPQGVLQMLG